MSYQDHLQNCIYCATNTQSHKPTIRIKGASSYNRKRKLSELASIITGVSYSNISYPEKSKFKAASSIERSQKLKELGKLIRG